MLKAYFFRVECSDGDDFLAICKHIGKLKGLARTTNVSDSVGEVRMEKPHPGKTTFAADLVRIRMRQIPNKIRRSGGTEEIELAVDQGIGEETAFIYDSKLNVLALQSNRSGVSAPAAQTYFSLLSPARTAILFHPILDLSEVKELDELTSTSSLKVAFTADSELESKGPPSSIGSVLKASKELGGPELDITFGVGTAWRKKKMNNSAVKRFVRFLMEKGGANVRSLQVHGRDEHEVAKLLDMLKYKLQYSEPKDPGGRNHTHEARIAMLERGLRRHKKKLSASDDDSEADERVDDE